MNLSQFGKLTGIPVIDATAKLDAPSCWDCGSENVKRTEGYHQWECLDCENMRQALREAEEIDPEDLEAGAAYYDRLTV